MPSPWISLQLRRAHRRPRKPVPRRTQTPLLVEHPDTLLHFEQSGARPQPERFQRRRHRKAYGLRRTGHIRHHQIGVKRIQAPRHAFGGCIERFEIHRQVCSLSHTTDYRTNVRICQSAIGVTPKGRDASTSASASPACEWAHRHNSPEIRHFHKIRVCRCSRDLLGFIS